MQNIKYLNNWIPDLHLWSNAHVNVHIRVALVTGLLQFLKKR